MQYVFEHAGWRLMGALPMLVAVGLIALPVWAGQPTAREVSRAHQWAKESFRRARPPAVPGPPISFLYDGKPPAELLGAWEFDETRSRLDDRRTRRVQTYTDPQTALTVRIVVVLYDDYPTVEWTVYLKNTRETDTPLIEAVQALDTRFDLGAGGVPVLHHNVGSPCEARDYAPLETPLPPGTLKHIAAAGGRPTQTDLSYFNIDWGDRGLIVAIGWPGQWVADFAADAVPGLHIRIGQELTHFRLHPGEEVRTPLIALQFREGGDWVRAQNTWRRWFIAHNLHRPGGKLPPTQWCGASLTTNMMVEATEENQKQYVDAYLARGLKPDFWWMDAGWYPCSGDWTCTGTWEPDPSRFPNGLRPVTDYLHDRGIRSILWFEPERVRRGTWLATEHPEWILWSEGDGLLDLGNPEAWQWLVDHVDRLLTEANLDIYRQDFNMDPLPYWRAHDAEDRQGITEIRHVTGLLAYWDELLRRHPGLLYDNCASGGRRNDLESMRRGVPYTKSDYADDPVGVQGETYGISLWLPYFAATWGTSDDPYLCRSRLAHVVGECLDVRVEGHLSELPRRLDEWRAAARCYWGDFYPLTPYSLANDAWIAWQFHLPESDEGVVQAFRRADCPSDSLTVRLGGLDRRSRYTVTDFDHSGSREMTGKDLMTTGLSLTAVSRPAALLLRYERRESP